MARHGGSTPRTPPGSSEGSGGDDSGVVSDDDHIDGLRFRITELRRSPGARMSEQRVVEPGNLSIGDAGAGRTPVTVDVDMESLADGVRVHARVGFVWSGACRRCLGPATGDTTSEFLELFVDAPEVYEGSDGREVATDAVFEVRQLTEGLIDLSDSVRDAILLGLPLAPLCGDDCEGPSPENFPVGVVDEREERSRPQPVDDRWSALDALEFSRDDLDPEAT